LGLAAILSPIRAKLPRPSARPSVIGPFLLRRLRMLLQCMIFVLVANSYIAQRELAAYDALYSMNREGVLMKLELICPARQERGPKRKKALLPPLAG